MVQVQQALKDKKVLQVLLVQLWLIYTNDAADVNTTMDKKVYRDRKV